MTKYDFTFTEVEMDRLKYHADEIKKILDGFLKLASAGKYAEASEELADSEYALRTLKCKFSEKRYAAESERNERRTRIFWEQKETEK